MKAVVILLVLLAALKLGHHEYLYRIATPRGDRGGLQGPRALATARPQQDKARHCGARGHPSSVRP
jgi:hypothetical protein